MGNNGRLPSWRPKARYSNSFMRETRVNKLPSTSQAYAVAGEQPALRTLIEAVRLHIFYATFDARRSSWHQLPEQTWIQAPYTCHFACYLCLDHQSALVYTYTRIHVYCIHVYTYTRIHVYTYTHIHVYTYTRIHVYTYTGIHVYTYTRIHVHTYYVYTCSIHVYTYTRIHVYTYTRIHVYT